MYLMDLYVDQSFDPGSREAYHLESDYLQQLDHKGVELQRRMVAGNLPSSQEDRLTWTRFLMALLNRHPDDVEKLKALHSVMWQQHEDEGLRNMRQQMAGYDPILIAANYIPAWRARQETQRVQSLKRMMDYGAAGAIIDRGRWSVLDFFGVTGDFVLSDKPVFRTETFQKPGDFIALPLGPKHLFVAQPATGMSGLSEIQPSIALLNRINIALVGQAKKYVVAVDNAQQKWICETLGTAPAKSIADLMAGPFGL